MHVVLDQLPACLKDPHNATLVLRHVKTEKEMPALLFDWNMAGFNARGQTPAVIVANLVAHWAMGPECQNKTCLLISYVFGFCASSLPHLSFLVKLKGQEPAWRGEHV